MIKVKFSLYRLAWGTVFLCLVTGIGALSCASAEPSPGLVTDGGINPAVPVEVTVPPCDQKWVKGVIREYVRKERVIVYEGQMSADDIEAACEHSWVEGHTTHCVINDNAGTEEVCGGRDDDNQDPNAWSKEDSND